MSRTKKLPDDVKRECLSLVRGYSRRRREYNLRRAEMMSKAPNNIVTIRDGNNPDDERKHEGVMLPGSHYASRTTEDITERIQGLEKLPDTQRMRAVEYAAERVGLDLAENDRQILVKAVFKSCIEGRRYPFERLGVEGMERSCFYERRLKFLMDIAKYMGLI